MHANPLVRRQGAVLLIENNNPKARNAFTPDYMEGLRRELEQAQDDPAVRTVVLFGAGEHFCAGGDLRSLRERRTWSLEQRQASLQRLHAMVLAVRGSSKPVVAAVEGYAVGAGLALALACDFVVASATAVFKASYVNVGLTPDGGTTASLAAIVPRQLANAMCMAAEDMGAERLHGLGCVNRVVPPGEAVVEALRFAERLAQGPRRALQRIKQLNLQAGHVPFAQHLDVEARAMAQALGDPESLEGIEAFLEKRQPDFTKVD